LYHAVFGWLCLQPKPDKNKQDKDPQYQYNLGLFYLNSNNVDEAIKCFNRSLNLNPNNYLAWNAIGLAQSLKTNFEASIQAFTKALAINPQFTEAHNNLGTIYLSSNNMIRLKPSTARL